MARRRLNPSHFVTKMGRLWDEAGTKAEVKKDNIMTNTKNILLAWVSSVSPLFAAIETRITIISAIILPIVFFAVGKTVDVCLQIYFRRCTSLNADRADGTENTGSEKPII